MRKIACAAAAAALLCAAPAWAQGYVGGGVGQTKFDIDGCGSGCDDSDTGWKLYGGYKFMGGLAAELNYFDFGKARARETDEELGSISATAKGSGFGLGLAYIAELTPDWEALARIGMARNRAKVAVSSASVSGSDSQTHWRPYYGLGVAYKITPMLSVGLDLDFTSFKYEGESDNVRMIGASLRASF